ncbi:MAG: hypothetical protein MJ113_03285 [Lachnospiraceae bacterium]|nr:hypothetical protein [Lachnospiraceae bacterium]
MGTGWIITLVILAVLLAGLVVLGIFARKRQKQAEEAQAQLKASAQTYSILVIDKKRMRLTDAGFPSVVVEQTPKLMRKLKVPVVKAKIGPKIMSLMCEEKIFDLIPVKKEVKAVMNGIYIIDVKGIRTNLDTRQPKMSLWQRAKLKATQKAEAKEKQKQLNDKRAGQKKLEDKKNK